MGFEGISVSTWVEVCFTHPYYNKVGTRMVEGRPDGRKAKRKPANHVGCTQWAGEFLLLLKLFNRACMSLYLFIIADTDQKNIARVAHDGIWILLIFDLL